MKAEASYQDKQIQIFKRPGFDMMTMNMLVKNKKDFDFGIWSSAGLDDSQNMVKNIFGRYLSQLLFVMYTDRA